MEHQFLELHRMQVMEEVQLSHTYTFVDSFAESLLDHELFQIQYDTDMTDSS